MPDDDEHEDLTPTAAIDRDAIVDGLVVGMVIAYSSIADFNDGSGLTVANATGAILIGVLSGMLGRVILRKVRG